MRIFLSAVSGQFKACRDTLASDLRAVGAEVMVQEDFQQYGRSLLEKLEAYIAGCDRVIVLVGNAYGWAPEPEARPTGRPLRSYTQWEYFFSQGERLDKAQVTPKETFVYLASPDFLASHPVEQTNEACTLQEQFVSEIRRSGKDRSQFNSLHELRALVLRDGFRLDDRGMTAVGLKSGCIPHGPVTKENLPAPADSLDLLKGYPEPQPNWVGRIVELKELNAAWASQITRVFAIIAFGGEGKTALARRFVESLRQHSTDTGPVVVWWSFYFNKAADTFFTEVLEHFNVPLTREGYRLSAEQRVGEVVRLLREGVGF